MKRDEMKQYMKNEIKQAYRALKKAVDSKDKKQIRNALAWMIATCEAVK